MLDELERLERAATPGPWHAADRNIGWEVHLGRHADGCWGKGPDNELTNGFRDTMSAEHAALIAAARNALPDLIAVARAAGELRVRLAECRTRFPQDAAGARAQKAFDMGYHQALAELTIGELTLASALDRLATRDA